MKTSTVLKEKKNQPAADVDKATKFNLFYNRFDFMFVCPMVVKCCVAELEEYRRLLVLWKSLCPGQFPKQGVQMRLTTANRLT